MKYHKLPFVSGTTTCFKPKEGGGGTLCPQVGSIRFGTIFVCRRFPSMDNAYTRLDEKGGYLQRCLDCIQSEDESSKAVAMLVEFIDGSRTYTNLVLGLASLNSDDLDALPPGDLKENVMGLKED